MKLLPFNKTNECPRRVGNTAHRTRQGFFSWYRVHNRFHWICRGKCKRHLKD